MVIYNVYIHVKVVKNHIKPEKVRVLAIIRDVNPEIWENMAYIRQIMTNLGIYRGQNPEIWENMAYIHYLIVNLGLYEG